MVTKGLFWWMVFTYLLFTSVNYYINVQSPEKEYKEQLDSFVKQYEKGIPKTVRQDSAAYAQVLTKIKQPGCTSNTDVSKDTYVTCEDGTKASIISWTRSDRKGTVTRFFDKNNNLIMIYGHPDDTY